MWLLSLLSTNFGTTASAHSNMDVAKPLALAGVGARLPIQFEAVSPALLDIS